MHLCNQRRNDKQYIIFVLLLLLFNSRSAQAIPSPDLVINLSASIAQLLGLLSVAFGGIVMSARKNAARKNTSSLFGSKIILIIAGIFLMGSLAANILQYSTLVDDRNERLHTNLVRNSVENGETVSDINLKTLSFSEQLDHPLGISTNTLAQWLENDTPLNIIDVREDEEFEIGAIDGAKHMRYPDVLADASQLPDTGRTLLLCYSGNRSSELCGELSKQGRQCNFMVGGYEKWLTESRPLSSNIDLSTEDFRQLPDFDNKDKLLDTPEVHQLVTEQGARFIDVRYPGDFAKGHLPDASNIPIRALSSSDLAERISSLPDVPYIAACYDRRSCFYSQLIGLRFDRAGLAFLGRYTVPHEYYSENQAEGSHLNNRKQDQERLTAASYIVTPLRTVLDYTVELSGHYVLGLLSVVLMIRLLLLPLALKAERDSRVQKSLAVPIAELKEEFSEHPRALADATVKLYKKFNIRPVLNILASLFQLSLMLLFYSAVSQSSVSWEHSFLWINAANSPDPFLIIPTLTAVLFIAVLATQSPAKTLRKGMLYALVATALLGLLQNLNTAINLYLAISMGFLLIQSLLFRIIGNALNWDSAGTDKTGSIADTGLIPLENAHYLPNACGKKASRLGQLIEAGYNVPDGFVLTSKITNKARNAPNQRPFSRIQTRRLNTLWKNLSTDRVAVRSSGANEDGADNSFAGVYESILNVSRHELETAVRTVYQSLCSVRSAAYSQSDTFIAELNHAAERGGVVVQAMVPAEFSGVLFTEHPGTTAAMMVEMVTGLGDELVSGNVTPDTFAFGKLSGQALENESSSTELPPIDLGPLLALGRELEALFEHPQDIEWAFAHGKYYLLQARDITRSISSGSSLQNLAERERGKLLKCLLGKRKRLRRHEQLDADAPVFVQNELSELLPRPTPFSADFMERLWSAGGSTDLACQDLGIPYKVHFRSEPYLNTLFGWTYVNKQEERRRLEDGPGALSSFRLARDAEKTEAHFREDFLPVFQEQMVERNAVAMEQLSLDAASKLLSIWVRRFVEETYFVAERINISADFHTKTALKKLAAAKLEPTRYLNHNEETIVSHALSLLSGNEVSAEDIEEFLMIFGHRAPLDYEFSEPRFSENSQLVNQYIERSSRASYASVDEESPSLPDNKVLTIAVQRARNFMCLKEEAKHYCLIELAQIRRLLLAIDKKCQLNGLIFQLRIHEVSKLSDSNTHAALKALARQRLAESQAWKDLQLPASLSVSDLERMDMLTGMRPDTVERDSLSGNRVAGDKEVIAMVRVITDIDQIHTFKEGEILVARMTDPSWYPLFTQAKGIITEVGGWLSHVAIVAREFDLPAIVGVPSICQRLNTGDIVLMTLNGSIKIMNEDDVNDSTSTASAVRNQARFVEVEEPPMSALDDENASPVSVYHLTSRKLALYQKGIERRAMKDRLGDRRSQPRFTANGEIERDRRAANRAANIKMLLKQAG